MINELNTILKNINVEPIADYIGKQQEINYEIRDGMARAYGISGFRKFLEREINIATRSAALIPENEVEMAAAKMRLVTLKELYEKMRQTFSEYEKINGNLSANN